MKVIILAGGWGTRLGKQTEDMPKPMLLIGNKPILWHIMKIYSHFGFRDFIVSTGFKAKIVKEYFRNYEINNRDFTKDFSDNSIIYHQNTVDIDWKVSVIDTGVNTLKGARIKKVEDYLDEDINMVTYGDGLSNLDIRKLLEFHNSHGKTMTISGVHPPSRFGEIKDVDSQVVSFEEKPQTSTGMINGGFMVFNKNLLDYLTTDENCDFEFNALEKLAVLGEVMVYKHEGSWECMDNERDLVHLNKLWDEGKAFWKVW
jgi:glucose-1-phosphate cytidylyltransferase